MPNSMPSLGAKSEIQRLPLASVHFVSGDVTARNSSRERFLAKLLRLISAGGGCNWKASLQWRTVRDPSVNGSYCPVLLHSLSWGSVMYCGVHRVLTPAETQRHRSWPCGVGSAST